MDGFLCLVATGICRLCGLALERAIEAIRGGGDGRVCVEAARDDASYGTREDVAVAGISTKVSTVMSVSSKNMSL